MSSTPAPVRSHSPGGPRRLRRMAVVATLVATGGILAACGSDDDTGDAVAEDPAAEVAALDATIVDVRTPEEFDAGHLDGAVNIDVQSASFADEIAALDPEGSYVVYCRSGNRSAAAVEQMRAAGFTDVTDLGGLQDAAASTGIAIVQ